MKKNDSTRSLHTHRENGEQNVRYQGTMNRQHLSLLQTVKNFVEKGFQPREYDIKKQLLHLENALGETITLAEVPAGIADFLDSIQE